MDVVDASGQKVTRTFQIVARENVSPFAPYVLPIAGVVALVAVAAIAALVVVRRRKKAPPPP